MNGGLSPTNPTLEAAFKTALLNQGVIALLIFVMLAIAWVACRELLPMRTKAWLSARQVTLPAEPAGRRLLRVGFGLLWVFDAILQAQPAMPGGLPSQVIGPAAASSPGWVQHLVNWAGTGWSYHPVQDATAAVWIQLGIGAWLIASARGTWSRLAGLASVGWGLEVWIFGEAFGGVLGHGASVLTGAPGGALIYCAAGILIALPARCWLDSRLGRRALLVIGGCLVALAAAQAWPGRGSWQGRVHGRPGPLATMIRQMAATNQPHGLARVVSDFGTLVAAHGFAANLIVVVVLTASAAALMTGRLAIATPAVCVLLVFFLADWVLVEDLGFFGGLGTDPNSMLPLALLLLGAFLAMARVPVQVRGTAAAIDSPADANPPATPDANPPATPDADRPVDPRGGGIGRRLRTALGTANASVVVALWAGAVMAIGAAPMAIAEADRTADPVIASSLNGPASTLNTRAAAFSLTDQNGRQVTLASLRGKVVLLTFLDPVCTTDCPLIAQEFRAADQVLGGRADRVALVAIVANPLYRSAAYTRAFDQQEQLTGVPNWLFLTGSRQQLSSTWRDYYVTAQAEGAGSMVLHPDVAYVIDGSGIARTELNMNPGPGTASSESSFAAELADAAERAMGSDAG